MNKNTEAIIIKEAIPSEAGQLITYVHALTDERDIYIALSSCEFKLNLVEERQILEKYTSSENSIFLVAEFEGKITGSLNCPGGSRKAIRHSARLGMSVSKVWRDQGVGSLLLEFAIQWARGNPVISRTELNVFVENTAAIHLFSEVGFQIEGTRRTSIFRDGRYHDDHLMAILL